MSKTWKNSPGAKAGVKVGDSNARVHGTEDNYINCDDRGTTISGPVSFVAMPNQIRMGGLWTLNNIMSLSLPSTMATPSPVTKIDLPLKQTASLIQQSVVMMTLVGML